MSLTAEQRDALETRGLVRLRGAIPAADVAAMAAALWAGLERKHGIRRDAPESWTVERPSGLSRVVPRGAYAAMASPTVRGALDDLLGRWAPPPNWGPALVAFPCAEAEWVLPHQSWHLDYPGQPGQRALSQVGRVFAILEPLAPHSGATLVAEGSHRLVEAEADRATRALTSAEARERLVRHTPWIRDLQTAGDNAQRIARFMDETTEADGVALRVVEMTGDPGDVWLMHPNALHGASPNVGRGPRMVVTQWVPARPWDRSLPLPPRGRKGRGWWCVRGGGHRPPLGADAIRRLLPTRRGHTTTQPSSLEEEGF